MGLTRKIIRHATPRSARRVMHPIRTVRIAATPGGIRRASYVGYSITNPLGAVENRVISKAFRFRGALHGTHFSEGPQTFSGTGVRAEEGAASAEYLERLMRVSRQRFSPIERQIIPIPKRKNVNVWFKPEWKKKRKSISFWKRAARNELKSKTVKYANLRCEEDFELALNRHERNQQSHDEWWLALRGGNPKVVRESLKLAFSDNVAKVEIISIKATETILFLNLPNLSVLPEKRMNVTPTGKLSAKKWTNKEKQQAYSELLAGHFLATAREGFSVAPSVSSFRIVGVLADTNISLGFFFDVDISKNSPYLVDDTYGEVVLAESDLGLIRRGPDREIYLRKSTSLRPLPKI